MIPQSGIDVVRLILSPIFFNVNYFKIHKNVDEYNKLTIHRRGMFYTLEIHIEYMDLFEDFHMTIAKALYDLIFNGYIWFPITRNIIFFIYENISWFVLGVSEIEFYFDLLRKSVKVKEESIGNELIQYNKNGEGQYSFYSNDYKAKKQVNIRTEKILRKIDSHSKVHIYDKYDKNIQDNQISRDILDKYPFQIRFEFKLYRDNCKFLSLINLQGNYFEILKRYICLLAIIYNNHVLGNITIKGKNNKELAKVINKSKTVRQRYTGKELQPTEPIPEWSRSKKRDQNDRLKWMIRDIENRNDKTTQNGVESKENDEIIDFMTKMALEE